MHDFIWFLIQIPWGVCWFIYNNGILRAELYLSLEILMSKDGNIEAYG